MVSFRSNSRATRLSLMRVVARAMGLPRCVVMYAWQTGLQRLVCVAVLVGVVWCGVGGVPVAGAQNTSKQQLNGGQVAEIARVFLRNHILRKQFDVTHANLMLKRYIRGLDPERVYFLQSDVKEFYARAKYLTRDVLQGRSGIAFTIHQRLLQRMQEAEPFLKKVLASSFKLKTTARLPLDWSKLKAPETSKKAETRWRLRLGFEALERKANGESLGDIREAFQRRYKGLRRRAHNYTEADILSAFLNAFTSAYDPHSTYLTQDDLENFYISMRLSLEGIGATLRWEDGRTIISSILPGGAAARHGGLKPEDIIVEVAQQKKDFEDVSNMRLMEVVKRIRGPRHTQVRIAVMRQPSVGSARIRKEFAITRQKIVLSDSEAKSKVYRASKTKPSGQPVQVITLPSFYLDFSKRRSGGDYKSATRDVARLISKHAKNVQGIVLDLRNNGGGSLSEAVSMVGLFARGGPVVQVRGLDRVDVHKTSSEGKALYRGPLVVLVNRYSASASEIVVGALQDYGRALIVGERSTFGKGTVQNVIELPQKLGALKTTVQKFYRPSGKSTQKLGVLPDITLPSLNNHLIIGETAHANALAWDSVPKANFRMLFVHPPKIIAQLKAQSKQRRAKQAYFKKVHADVQDYLTNRKGKKYVSVAEVLAQAKKNRKNQNPVKANKNAPPNAKKSLKEDPVLQETLAITDNYIDALRKIRQQKKRNHTLQAAKLKPIRNLWY